MQFEIIMKPIIQKLWMALVISSLSISSSAYDFEVDGIYYNVLSLDDMTCEVTYNADNRNCQNMSFCWGSASLSYPSYSGSITIPAKVNYKGRELSVTRIGEYAFLNCTGLTSLSLPSTITQIEEIQVSSYRGCYAGAFDYCNIETLIAGNAHTLERFNQSYASAFGSKTKNNLKYLVLTNDFYGIISVDFSDYKKLVSVRSNVENVPLFSNGDHFTNGQYLSIEVLVQEDVLSEYQSSNIWKNFWELKAMNSVK